MRVLPSGRHQARYVGPDGKRYDAPITFDSHAAAEEWLATQRARIAAEMWKSPTPSFTFGEYAARWLEQRNLKPRTAAHYQIILVRFLLPEFTDVQLKAITPDMVRVWHAKLITGPTYKAHAYSLLRTIMRTAVDDRLIDTSPCVIRGAGAVKRKVVIRPATLAELEAIATAMPGPYRLMVVLGAWAALRFGELDELRRSDVDLNAGIIRVRRAVSFVNGEAIVSTPKSAAGRRDVHLPPHILPAVREHLRNVVTGRDGLIFPGPNGDHLAHGTFADWWHAARDQAGRPDLRFHDLRHTGAVMAASTGATLAELMARLGHSTPQAALRYQHAAQGADARIAQRLSELASGRDS